MMIYKNLAPHCRGLLLSATLALTTGCSTLELVDDPQPDAAQVAKHSFGVMERFVGRQFVSGETILEVAAEDQGGTLLIKYNSSEYRLRKTANPGRLQVISNPEAKAVLDDRGTLTLEAFDKMVISVNGQQMPHVSYYRREYGAIWDSYKFRRGLDFVVRTADSERIERAKQQADDQQRREAAHAEREASLATARAWAGALSGIAASLPPAPTPAPVYQRQAPPAPSAPQTIAGTGQTNRQALAGSARPTAEPHSSGSALRPAYVTSSERAAEEQQRRAQADAAKQRQAAEQKRWAAAQAAAQTEAERQQLAKTRADEQREQNALAGWERMAAQYGTLGGGAAPSPAESYGKAGAWCTRTKNGEFRCMGPAYKSTGTWAQLDVALRMVGCSAGKGYTPVVGSGQHFDCGRPLKGNENVMPTYDPYAGTN